MTMKFHLGAIGGPAEALYIEWHDQNGAAHIEEMVLAVVARREPGESAMAELQVAVNGKQVFSRFAATPAWMDQSCDSCHHWRYLYPGVDCKRGVCTEGDPSAGDNLLIRHNPKATCRCWEPKRGVHVGSMYIDPAMNRSYPLSQHGIRRCCITGEEID